MKMGMLPALLCAAWLSTDAVADSLAITRIEQTPRIDGRLDDAAWLDAARIEPLTQVTPDQGAPGSQATQVWIAFDSDALYVAVRAAAAVAEIRATTMQRDDSFDADDTITIVLDPFDRRLNGYAFSVNPLGARTEALLSRDLEPQYEWDAVWDAAAFIGQDYWSVEIRVPFKSLSFDAQQTAWAFNIERVLRKHNEVQRWRGASMQYEVTTLSAAGRITGIDAIRASSNLDLTPSLVVRRFRDFEGKTRSRVEPSLDATWRVRPALHATLTVNTDFAEAEIDKPQSNYTRFPLFVPEQRDFFLADAAYFSFADIQVSPLPFFSRRIGLDEEGNPVDIDYGAKLAGREGPWVLAALHAHTAATDTVPEKDLSVARIARQFGESTVGVIGTHGDPRSVGNANLMGVDFNYLNSNFRPDTQLAAHAWLLRTDSDAAFATDIAGGVALKFPNDPLWVQVSAEHYGDDFDPALGFVERTGIRKYEAFASRRMHVPYRMGWIETRDVYIEAEGLWVTDSRDRFDSYEFETPVIVALADGSKAIAEIGLNRQIISDEFDVADDVSVQPGDYREWRRYVELSSSPAYPVNAVLHYDGGGYYGGSLDTVAAETYWRPSPHWRVSLGYEFSALRLPQGDADTHLASMRVDWFWSTRLSWSNTAQYESESDRFGLHSRLRWILPGDNDFFLVYRRGQFNEWTQIGSQDEEFTEPVLHRSRRFEQSITAKIEWRFAL